MYLYAALSKIKYAATAKSISSIETAQELITNNTYSSACGITFHRGKPEKTKEARDGLRL